MAKEYNNAIRNLLLSIPLDHVRHSISSKNYLYYYLVVPVLQICFPGLHLTLGIFNRLFDLLEEACQELDMKLCTQASQAVGGTSYNKHVAALRQLKQLQEQHTELTNETNALKQLMTYLLLIQEASGIPVTVQQVSQEYLLTEQQLKNKVLLYLFFPGRFLNFLLASC